MGYNYLTEQKTLWGKGKIARYDQLLLVPQGFQKFSRFEASK